MRKPLSAYSSFSIQGEIWKEKEREADNFSKNCQLSKNENKSENATFFLSEMPNSQKPHTQLLTETLIHVCIWLYVFISPFFFHPGNAEFNFLSYFRGFIFPMLACVIFYLNYFYLVPHFFLTDQKKRFFVFNIITILLITIMGDFMREMLPHPIFKHEYAPPVAFSPNVEIFMKLRGLLSYIFIAALATFVNLGKRWAALEDEHQKAELGRKEAELKNLKNQINPHFLLNTLNNIYALTAFAPAKAQNAIQELSKMLRYLLYENDANEVLLSKEIEFIQNYIQLMRIRLPERVKISTKFPEKFEGNPTIAPMILISLVENAFKHGISPTKDSFINIVIETKNGAIDFLVENSFYPKKNNDKTPGGIGFQQVERRLDLSYFNRHKWEKGYNEATNTYFSHIVFHPE